MRTILLFTMLLGGRSVSWRKEKGISDGDRKKAEEHVTKNFKTMMI